MPLARLTPLLLLALLLASPRPAAADTFTLDTLMAAMAAAPARRAAFIEQRRFAALAEPLELRGHLSYRAGHLEKDTDGPQPERLKIDGERVIVTTANDPPRVIPLSAAPELRLFIDAIRAPLTGDTAALRHAFYPALTGSPAAWALTLIPRNGTQTLRSVRLEGHADTITQITITQPNGDTQTTSILPE